MTHVTGGEIGLEWGFEDGEDGWGESFNRQSETAEYSLLSIRVTSMGVNDPPASPAQGDRYVTGSAPTGAWAGHAKNIVIFSRGAWRLYPPHLGFRVYNEADQKFYGYSSGGTWTVLATTVEDEALLRANTDASLQAQLTAFARLLMDVSVDDPGLVPLVKDQSGNVPLWLENGGLAAAGLAGSFINLLLNALNNVVTSKGVATPKTFGSSGVRSAAFVPLVVDHAGKVPAWLESGKLALAGLSDSLVTMLIAALSNKVAVAGITTMAAKGGKASPSYVPLVVDGAGKVPVWLEGGLLGATGLSAALIASLGLSNGTAPLDSVPSFGQKVIASDGRSLWKFRAKASSLKQSGNVPLRIGFGGDSWSEQVRIPAASSTLLTAEYGKSGDGFVNVGTNNLQINGVTFAKSATGWTAFDVSPDAFTTTAPTHGCGPDGFALTASGATATATFGNLTATQITILSRNEVGAFRYRIDGGSWTTVAVTTGDASVKSTVISGLSNTAHTLEIDTTGNTGSVTLFGVLSERPTVGGATLFKIGNGSCKGAHYTAIKDEVAKFSSALALDLLILQLGTNDYRVSDLAGYSTGLTDLITAHRSANPDLGVILIPPARNNIVASPVMSAFRDAALTVAKANNAEFYNMHDDWSTWAKENALGQFADDFHISDAAAWRPARALMRHFLGAQ